MRTTIKGLIVILTLLGYVSIVAIRGAFYGYARNGIPGSVLGLAIGTFVGFLSAFVWCWVYTIIFKIGSSIVRRCKGSVRENS
jgi:hypothetical protein